MKKITKIFLTLLLSFAPLQATVYENAEDLNSSDWYIYDNTPVGASISINYDTLRKSYVIELNGTNRANGFILGDFTGKSGSWKNSDEKILQWDMNVTTAYSIYVSLLTESGARFIQYTADEESIGLKENGYIHIGLGQETLQANWSKITRDLEADLQSVENNNTILATNGFLVRGSGSFDNIILFDNNHTTLDTLYHDSEENSTQAWHIYDNTPSGAAVIQIFDSEKNATVTELIGTTRANGFILGGWAGSETAWNNETQHILSLAMQFSTPYTFYISAQTTLGHRYIQYTGDNYDLGDRGNGYIHRGLGEETLDGTWRHITLNLEADLQTYEENNNSILALDAFLVRGSGKLDDITLSQKKDFSDIKHLIHTAPLQTTKPTYICVGDSTRAESIYEGEYLFYELRDNLSTFGLTSHLLARRGHKVLQFLDESVAPTWRDVVALIPADGEESIVDISLGINDLWYDGGENIIPQLTQAISHIKIQRPRTKFILTMPNRIYTPYNPESGIAQTDILKEKYLTLSESLNIPLNNVVGAVMPSHEETEWDWYNDDGFFVHMSPLGQHLVAQYLLTNLLH